MSDDYRFQAVETLYGSGSLEKLQNSHIAIIGIGGVGSWASEMLVRSGLGEITLVDLDDICTSNINRQVHALSSTVGKIKTEAMKERPLDINKHCKVHTHQCFYSLKSFKELLSQPYDFVLDAFDNARLKAHLVAECIKREQKLLVTGGAAGVTDMESIKLIDLAFSINDPLLFQIRKILRKEYGLIRTYKDGRQRKKLGLHCIFSPQERKTVPLDKTDISSVNNCNKGLGSAAFITASFANHAVAHIMDEIL